MYRAWLVSLSSLLLACMVGFLFWAFLFERKRRKRRKDEELKRRIKELTGEDYVKGHTTVKDLERMYGKKG